ncbi:uncharacterized protein LOC143861463 [Tasmannia lanceolata]|uniref:uncharacterized protein LOC143861463 n=1 Tax=Tasmannia lanceolata TaxID=3420 RepID=UPI0040645A78
MVDGHCKFHYPWSFSETTTQAEDGYTTYGRRCNGRQVHIRNRYLDNRWVVPYNPYLLRRYNCHINVEICSSIKAVKYLYKYIYKGHDRVAMQVMQANVETTVDEIQSFQNARWVSPPEAIWRIYGFDLCKIYTSVINLQLHLPNQQFVTYWKNQKLPQLLQQEHVTRTMLTEYFNMNIVDVDTRKYLYREFPEYYVWNGTGRFWTRRKNQEAIGRIRVANPSESDTYYLRLLLNHIRGATSFTSLLIVNEHLCTTFREVAQKNGLLEDYTDISSCLQEASTFAMPSSLRRLFATILVFCEPNDVRLLWDAMLPHIAEDLRIIPDNCTSIKVSYVLNELDPILKSMGKSLKIYDLLKPSRECNSDAALLKEILEEKSIITPPEDVEAISQLNVEQECAFQTIMKRINDPTSGVAASIIPGGRTAHSRFKIPIDVKVDTVCGIPKQSSTSRLLAAAAIIIWDEAPMSKKYAVEALDRALQDIMESLLPFGGNGDEDTISGNLVEIPVDMLIKYEDNILGSDYLAERGILTTKNEYVDDLNKNIVGNCRGDAVTYYSYDTAVDDTHTYYPEEFLNSLTPI